MLKSIVTHPGSAHKDDFLACCVLLAQTPVVIQRRNPSNEDLADPSVAVIDIGHEHTPEKNNFDHHQLPREHVPTCALSLVLQHLGLYKDARNFCDWLETTEWMDCRGPIDTAKWLGIDLNQLSKLNSPVEVTMIRRFAAQDEHQPDEPVWNLMHMIGKDLVEHITGLNKRLNFIAKHSEIWKFDGFKALFMPRTDPLPKEPSIGLGRYIKQQSIESEVLATIYPDRRGQGYGMRRFNDDLRMDFTKLADEEDVHFTHTRGFIAKTSVTDIKRLKSMVKQAYQE